MYRDIYPTKRSYESNTGNLYLNSAILCYLNLKHIKQMLQMSCVPSFTSASLQKKLFIVDNPRWIKVILTLKNMKVVMKNNEYKFNLENLNK